MQYLRNGIISAVVIVFTSAIWSCSGSSSPDPPVGPVGPATLVSVAISPKTSISLLETRQLVVVGSLSDGTSKVLNSATWSSSNSTTISVSSSGEVKGLSLGEATLTVVSDSLSDSVTLTVVQATLTSISLTPANPVIFVPKQQQFTATGTFSNGLTQDITSSVRWSASNANATISDKGLATGVSDGTVTITATSQGITRNALLTITHETPDSIFVTPLNPFVLAGITQQFTATGTYSNGPNQDLTASVTWSSSNGTSTAISNVAGNKGKATALTIGTSTITATFTPISGGAPVSGQTIMKVSPGTITALTITPTGASIAKGTKTQFKVMGTFDTGGTFDLTSLVGWTSSLTAVVAIDASGVATGNINGSTTIRAAFGTMATSTLLNVTNAALNQISVTPVSVSIHVSDTRQFVATGAFNDSSTQDLGLSVDWTSSATSTATIGGSSGLATGQSSGTTTITATATFGDNPKKTGSALLAVRNATLNSLVVTPVNPIIPVGTSQQFKATGVYSDGASEDLTGSVTWSAVGTAATIDSVTGLAVGSAVGTSTITASFFSQTSSTRLEVIDAALVAISVLPKTGSSIPVGITRQYTARGTYNNDAVYDLTNSVIWGSSQPGTATVGSAGLAKAISAGTTNITATLGSIFGTSTLVVNSATLTSVSVTPNPASIAKGTTLQYKAEAAYSDSTIFDVTPFSNWSSSDGSKAIIGASTGLATASKTVIGDTTIAAAFDNRNGTATLTVKDIALNSIKVTPDGSSIALGATRQFKATGLFDDSSTQDFTTSVIWQSNPASIVTISDASGSKGLATAVATGGATITAFLDALSGSAAVTVTNAAATDLFLGADHTCARLTNGTMRCWGANFSGQLGDGTTQNRSIPHVISQEGASLMATGGSHTCAALGNGTVDCWGENGNGQLGNGTNNDSKFPAQLSGVLGATALTAGGAHTCAVFGSGAVKCWGGNSKGQVGDGSTTDRLSPVLVNGLSSPDKIAAGGAYTCALSSGSVQCWGDNSFGQLGNGNTATSTTPVFVTSITTATSISSGGSHSCAILQGGGVQCWGKNDKGQLGNNNATTTAQTTPVAVTGLATSVIAISAGGSHTCALLQDGGVQCWGDNSSGQLGDNSTTDRHGPVSVSGITTATIISAGGSHTCALLSDGSSKCWGSDNFGQLGDDIKPISLNPVLVPEITSGITHIGTGASFTCARISDGTIKCLGDNQFGQLGNGTTKGSNMPVAVSGISTTSAVALGYFHACALIGSPGSIQCWGENGFGKLGNGNTTSTSTPVGVFGISSATVVSAGNNHTCAVLNGTTGGPIQCWGDRSLGQLGDGSNSGASSIPVDVMGISNALSVSAGASHTCALLSDKTIKCWGNNESGQLGNGSTANTSVPVTVSGIVTATAISSGGAYTCALLFDNTVQCWGANDKGQLGIGTSDNNSHLSPVAVSGLTSVASIMAGSTHTCARLLDNTVQCWGDNGFGQLGNGTTADTSAPGFVTEAAGGHLSSVSAVSAGGSGGTDGSHTCAIISDGTLKCWGNNALGQIGSGLQLIQKIPVSVQGL